MRMLLACLLVLFLVTWSFAAVRHCCHCQFCPPPIIETDSSKLDVPVPTSIELEKAVEWKLKFEVYKDEKNEFRWRVKSRNGRITGDSGEGYHNKSDMLKDIESYQLYAGKAEVVEIKK